ncbi:MAG: hypothetical protein GY854_00240, partial [Deltaproteobacteria bacterium]|nr:hypothetical protein [Deltaproteobacteria bacterium]
ENVPFDWNIALEIVDTGPDGVDPAATQIWVDGVLALDSGVFQPGFTGVDSELVTTADSLRIVIDPVAHFESQATVEVRVVSAVVGETQTLDETYSFVIEDRTAPRVLAARAGAPTVYDIDRDGFVFFDFQSLSAGSAAWWFGTYEAIA